MYHSNSNISNLNLCLVLVARNVIQGTTPDVPDAETLTELSEGTANVGLVAKRFPMTRKSCFYLRGISFLLERFSSEVFH